MTEEQIEKENKFIREYNILCVNHGLQLVCEDPYCGLCVLEVATFTRKLEEYTQE